MANRILSNTGDNIGVDIDNLKLDFQICERNIHWQTDNFPSGIKQVFS